MSWSGIDVAVLGAIPDLVDVAWTKSVCSHNQDRDVRLGIGAAGRQLAPAYSRAPLFSTLCNLNDCCNCPCLSSR